MALCLKSGKKRIYINGIRCTVNYIPSIIYLTGVKLISSDKLALKDSSGRYITTPKRVAYSIDGQILTDSNNVYITLKE